MKFVRNVKKKKMKKGIKNQSPLPPKKNQSEISFPEAIKAVINGKKVRRLEWSNQEEYCLLKDSFLTIYRNDKFAALIVSEGDLMAIDWVVV